MAQELLVPEPIVRHLEAHVWTNQKLREQPESQIIPVNLLCRDFVSQESLPNRVCNFTPRLFSQFWIELHQGPQPRDTPIGVSGRGDKPKNQIRGFGALYENPL